MKENKDLVVNNETGLTFQGDAMAGVEDIDNSQVSIPRVKLLQSTSPEVQGDEYRDLNLRAGDLIENVGKDKIDGVVIPIKVLPTTNVLFVPRTAEGKTTLRNIKTDLTDTDLSQQGGMICIAPDGKTGDRYGSCATCKLCMFRGNEKPICSKAINVLVLLSNGLPAIVSFRDTSFKHGNKFVGLLRNKAMTGTPIQAMKFKLTPAKKTAGDKQWYELTVIPSGYATQEEYNQSYEIYKSFNNLNIQITADDVKEEPTVATQNTEINSDIL